MKSEVERIVKLIYLPLHIEVTPTVKVYPINGVCLKSENIPDGRPCENHLDSYEKSGLFQ